MRESAVFLQPFFLDGKAQGKFCWQHSSNIYCQIVRKTQLVVSARRIFAGGGCLVEGKAQGKMYMQNSSNIYCHTIQLVVCARCIFQKIQLVVQVVFLQGQVFGGLESPGQGK